MPTERHDVVKMLMRLRMDLTDAQVKVTDAIRLLGELDVNERLKGVKCPSCELVMSERRLADHLANVHGQTPKLPAARIPPVWSP